jgi:hypothetical protein
METMIRRPAFRPPYFLRATRLLAAVFLTLTPSIARTQDPQKQETQRFDGRWATTVSCNTSKGAPPASVTFVTEVRDGVLLGQRGSEGLPGYLRIDGKVTPSGIGHIYAKGRSAANEHVAGQDLPAGTEYAYYIQAKFERASGAGNRVEGRACAYKFEKR